MIEAHGTRTLYMRLGSVTTLIRSKGKLVTQGYRCEAESTGCKMSKGERSVTLDIVKNSFWVDAKADTMAEGARNADARLVAPAVDGLPEELLSSSGPTPCFETARASRRSSWTVLQKHKSGEVYLRERERESSS